MAITTFDGATAGVRPPVAFHKAVSGTLVAGRPFSSWPIGGNPGAGSQSGSLAGATYSSSNTGALSKGNPSSGNSYLYNLTGWSSAQPGTLFLVDRLWSNGGFTITSTAGQTVNSATWPSRCPTSATDDTPATTGHGVLCGMEISGATGAGTPTITMAYTNSAGTGSRSATNTVATVASSIVGTFYPIGLQAGDVGVQSVQTITLSATWTSGTMNLVAYRVLAAIPCTLTGVPYQLDWMSAAARLYDSSCLQLLFYPSTTSTTQVGGLFTETHG